MSTPIRLIAKKALSPNIYKSPNPQNTKNAKNFIQSPTIINKPKLFRKSLTFSNILITSPNKKEINVPLINTPERKKILKNGSVSNLNINILGKGTFGTVFQALYKDENVAMKLLKNKSSTITRESNAIKLNHKNIIKILQITNDVKYNHAIIVMQQCSQCDLQGLLDNNQNEFTTNLISKWALDICEALLYCHNNGIVHLDVKPKNILLKNNDCVLCDFGNSLSLNDEEQKKLYLEQVKGEFCGGGTVIYSAPELFCLTKNNQFNFPTFATDVYSFGITLWQMENRRTPYENMDNIHCIIYAVVKNGLRPKISNNLNNKNIQDLYISCWNAAPEKRNNLLNVKDKLLQIIHDDN